jgi:hypothetical protein
MTATRSRLCFPPIKCILIFIIRHIGSHLDQAISKCSRFHGLTSHDDRCVLSPVFRDALTLCASSASVEWPGLSAARSLSQMPHRSRSYAEVDRVNAQSGTNRVAAPGLIECFHHPISRGRAHCSESGARPAWKLPRNFLPRCRIHKQQQ